MTLAPGLFPHPLLLWVLNTPVHTQNEGGPGLSSALWGEGLDRHGQFCLGPFTGWGGLLGLKQFPWGDEPFHPPDSSELVRRGLLQSAVGFLKFLGRVWQEGPGALEHIGG